MGRPTGNHHNQTHGYQLMVASLLESHPSVQSSNKKCSAAHPKLYHQQKPEWGTPANKPCICHNDRDHRVDQSVKANQPITRLKRTSYRLYGSVSACFSPPNLIRLCALRLSPTLERYQQMLDDQKGRFLD